MKLTNISLAILVALGLAACGGSDDNTPQTTDNQEAGNQNTGGNGGNGGNGGDDKKKNEEIKKDDNNIDPTRKAADLTVKPALVDAVNADKKVLISNRFGNEALGYDSADNYEDKSTKPGDVKYTTTYNFLDESDVFVNNLGNNQNQVGAIYPSKNPTNGAIQNAFVKGKSGKYYRVKADGIIDNYTAKTNFKLVDSILDGTTNANKDKDVADVGYSGGTKIPQSKVVFLANAKISGGAPDLAEAIVDPSKRDGKIDPSLGQAVLSKVSVLGNSYNPSDINQSLDLNKIPVDATKITTVPVVGELTINNSKRDPDANDRIINRKIEVGHLKAYNLGYSIAYVGLDASKENSKNIFNLDPADVLDNADLANRKVKPSGVPGQYQVSGYKTLALPKDGRAIYEGKSFSESTEGDVKLVAEFFEDRASVKGLVNNRKNILDDNKALPSLTLQPIDLTSPEHHHTGGTGKVTGDVAHITDWTVQFYGLEAEEAGGYLKGNNYEVYTTQRKELSNKSNTADVK